MFRFTMLLALGTLLLAVSDASAQTCPLNGTSSNKLVCLIPQVYGPYGLGAGGAQPKTSRCCTRAMGMPRTSRSDFLTSFAPINETVGIELSQLPVWPRLLLPSASSTILN